MSCNAVEEARYELWLLQGGREIAHQKHKRLAEESIENLKAMGWTVIQQREIKEIEEEWPHVECIIRKRNIVKLIRWNSFNKGWMTPANGGGWVIFEPTKRE